MMSEAGGASASEKYESSPQTTVDYDLPAESGDPTVPMRMQMFSTWEVRKVPANCVSRYVKAS